MFSNCCDFTSRFVHENNMNEGDYSVFHLEDAFGRIVSWNNKVVYAIHVKNLNIIYFTLEDGDFFHLEEILVICRYWRIMFGHIMIKNIHFHIPQIIRFWVLYRNTHILTLV